MQDAQIVALMAAGDRAGLAAAYDAYADRLYDYARSLLRSADPDAAADVTQDTFLIAYAKVGDLRDPERLRPWLYAITRNECLRVLRQTRRTEALEPADLETATDAALEGGTPDMSTNIVTADLQELVHAAADGLSPKDREVFDLGMRHDLSASEVAAALGVSANSAHALLSRVRAQFERALGAFVVARNSACTDLDALLKGWDGTFDALWRKRIARHVDSCLTCAGIQERELSPAALLAVAPLAVAPVAVRSRLFDDELDLVSASRAALARGGLYDESGFPVEPLGDVLELEPGVHREGPERRRRTAAWLFVAAVAALLVILGMTRWLPDSAPVAQADPTLPTQSVDYSVAPTQTLITAAPQPRPTPTRTKEPSPTETPTVLPSATYTPPVVVPTPTPTPTPAPTRTPRPSPTATPTPGTLTANPVRLSVARGGTATVLLTAVGGPVKNIKVTDTADNAYVLIDPGKASLAEGESTVITINIADVRETVNSFQIFVSPGGLTITVSVS
ncbi:MAG TPA: RNA polymerase sigma factor [Nocardioidaceae bacterium]|nr:RNA polymerase sigma factor [Nocardioidaceae bacterium]